MVKRKGRGGAIDYHKGIILTLSPLHTPKIGKRDRFELLLVPPNTQTHLHTNKPWHSYSYSQPKFKSKSSLIHKVITISA